MTGFIVRWLINAVTLIVVVKFVPAIDADSTQTILWAALILGFLNTVLRPLIIFLTLPLYIFSLGLFTLIVNGFMLYLVPKVVPGFYIRDFWSAFCGALIFSIISFFFNLFIEPPRTVTWRVYRRCSLRQSQDDHVIDVEARPTDEEK